MFLRRLEKIMDDAFNSVNCGDYYVFYSDKDLVNSKNSLILQEDQKTYVGIIELIGIKKDNISVVYKEGSKNSIVITAKIDKENDILKRKEDIIRTYIIPEKIDKESIDINYENGILVLTCKIKDELISEIKIK